MSADADARLFLNLWFGEGRDNEPDGHVLVWKTAGKRSAWFQSLEQAANYAINGVAEDTYFGVCLSSADHGARYRLHSKKRPAHGIPGLWLDIDVAGKGHKKKHYPPTLDDARKLIADVPIKPTIIIATGGGIHCYWGFNEIWKFRNDAERAAAQALTRRWHHLVLAAAEARGWTMDNVSDLERVMRLPGTFNVKDPKNPKPVTILETSDWRYSPEDFDLFLKSVDTPSVAVSRETVTSAASAETRPSDDDAQLVLSTNAEPPVDKLLALFAASRRAKETWERKRKDFKDQSGSSYDQAMANFCVRAGWPRQETTNALIALRRKHWPETLARKLREHYFEDTYSKAYATFRRFNESVKKVERVSKTYAELPEEEKKQSALDLFNELVGTDLSDCIILETKKAEFRFKHVTGKRMVLTPAMVRSYAKFRGEYFDHFVAMLPPMKQPVWEDEAIPILLKHCEGREEKVEDEGSDEASMIGWIEEYLTDQTIHETLTEVIYRSGDPLIDAEGNRYVRNDDVRRYIGRRLDNKIPVARMPSLLRSAGLEPVQRKIAGSGGRVARYWKLGTVVPLPKAEEDS